MGGGGVSPNTHKRYIPRQNIYWIGEASFHLLNGQSTGSIKRASNKSFKTDIKKKTKELLRGSSTPIFRVPTRRHLSLASLFINVWTRLRWHWLCHLRVLFQQRVFCNYSSSLHQISSSQSTIQACFSPRETLLSSTFARVNHLLLLTISSSMSGDGKPVFQTDDASRFKGSSADFEAAQQNSSWSARWRGLSWKLAQTRTIKNTQ